MFEIGPHDKNYWRAHYQLFGDQYRDTLDLYDYAQESVLIDIILSGDTLKPMTDNEVIR